MPGPLRPTTTCRPWCTWLIVATVVGQHGERYFLIARVYLGQVRRQVVRERLIAVGRQPIPGHRVLVLAVLETIPHPVALVLDNIGQLTDNKLFFICAQKQPPATDDDVHVIYTSASFIILYKDISCGSRTVAVHAILCYYVLSRARPDAIKYSMCLWYSRTYYYDGRLRMR